MNRTVNKKPPRVSGFPAVLAIVIGFAAILFVTAASLPFRLDEILQIAAIRFHSGTSLFASIAHTPGAAPLNYFLQAVISPMAANSPLGNRFFSIVFGIAALFAFWRLAKLCLAHWTLPAVCLFAILPIHFMLAATARPYEQALFFLLLSTIWFFRVSSAPSVISAAVYSALLLLCIYSEPFAFLPAIGYLLFYLRFVNRKEEKNAFWFLLPSTIAPLLLFLPYYFWAAQQVNRNWIYSNAPADSAYLQTLQTLAPIGIVGDIISILLVLGTVAALFQLFRLPTVLAARTVGLFSLAGGVVTTVILVLLLDMVDRSPVWPYKMFWIAPEMIILFFAAPDSFVRRKKNTLRTLAGGIATLLIGLCVAGDVLYLRSDQTVDLKKEAAAIPKELIGDSCVVFVSEGLSRFLFLTFQPELRDRECLNFNKQRAVLAIHPFVTPDSEESAISFFRGLNFSEAKRINAGGGQIIVMEQTGQ
ncbi:MAG: glycosyltransferase family 39 protein [Acidobacteriota bacterium]|nr:glycosyltransferase family 39 protein [Acidobacteriota bacterium]